MKKLLIIVATTLLTACYFSSSNKENYQIKILNTHKIKYSDTLQIQVYLDEKNIAINEILINHSPLKKIENGFKVESSKLGKQTLEIVINNNGKKETLTKNITIYAQKPPKLWSYKIINQYPRKPDHYTQGLEFHNDTLYESIGLYGKSKLLKVDFKTGSIYKETSLPLEYFAEGITFLNGKIYQLTWQEHTAFVYNASDFKLIKKLSYPQQGWGICNDENLLYMSDGTDKIWKLSPNDFSVKDYIQLCSNTSIFEKANELEWVNGKIYANTYMKSGIMIINPENGGVEAIIDMRGLQKKVSQTPDLDVLNGIAYHPTRKTFFITGKNWDKLFEVTFFEK